MSAAGRLPITAFALLLPLAFWPPFEDAFKLPQHALLVLFAAWLAGTASLRRDAVTFRPEAAGLLAAVWLAAGASPGGTAAGDLVTLSALVIAGWLLPARLGSARAAPVLPALGVAGALSAGYSVWQFLVGDPAGGMATRGLRPFSTMGNPDFLAAFLLAVFPWQVASWLRSGSWWWGGAAAVTGGALLIAQSRGAWLGVAAVGAALPVLVRLAGGRVVLSRRLLAGTAVAALAAAGYLALHTQSRERFLAMFRTGHFDAAGRFAMWRATATMIADRPVTGHGPGGYGRMHPAYHAGLMARDPGLPWFYSENAHNDPLQIAAETGVPGLGAALWWLCCLARLAWLAHRRSDPDGLPVLLGLTGTAVNAMFNFPWYLIPTAAWGWLAYAVLAARHGPRPAAAPGVAPSGLRPVVVMLVAGVLLGRMFAANGWLKLAGDCAASGRWRDGLVCAERAEARWLGWEHRSRVAGVAASAAYGANEFATSERWAAAALAREPWSPPLRHQLGLALARQEHRGDAAEAAVRGALLLNPRLAEAWHTLGNLGWMRRDRRAAGEAWRRAVALNPGLTGAAESLRALEAEGRRGPGR